MSTRFNLREAIDLIQTDQPRVTEKLPPGQKPGGNLPGGQIPEGESPTGKQPLGNKPSSNQIEGESTEAMPQHSVKEPILGSELRRSKRKDKITRIAQSSNPALAQDSQAVFMETLLSEGWGRLAHGITRKLKSPGRFGLKLVDVALILTVHDHTLASVQSCAFAAISSEDFRVETGMDEKNIRAGLKNLVSRGVLLKVNTGLINFFGINPYFFLKSGGQKPTGKLPRGNQPTGDSTSSTSGNLPGGNPGQTTRGQSDSTIENKKEFSAPKNLQEPFKESLLSEGNFPSDMIERWKKMAESGKGSKAKSERETFQEIFTTCGTPFFENCGKVVQFLEIHGTGKKDGGKIHSPMTYIKDYWEENLDRYRTFLRQEEDLKTVHAERLRQEAIRKAEEDQRQRAKSEQEKQDAKAQKILKEGLKDFLAEYSDSDAISEFVESSLQAEPQDYVRRSWKTWGWDHPMVQSFTVRHFLARRSGSRIASGHSAREAS